MHLKKMAVLVCCCFALDIPAAHSAGEFCGFVRNSQWSDLLKVTTMIHAVQTARTASATSGSGRSAEDIERTIAPYKLSEGLKQAFADIAEDDDHDYDVYRTPDGSIFNFSTVEGSEKCPVDIWAVDDGGKLKKSDVNPDVGDACDVVRIYGSYLGTPILVQYSYDPSGDTNSNLSQRKIQEVRVVSISKNGFGDVCVVKP